MAKPTLMILRESERCRVADGAFLFREIDTHGMPLEILLTAAAERGIIFDLGGFATAAARSGNWSRRKLNAVVQEAMMLLRPPTHPAESEFQGRWSAALDAAYGVAAG